MKQVNENGFWRIENNPISQVGVFPYLGKNISDKLEPNKIYFVYRPAEELFAPETLESFNSTPLPLVDEHEMLGDGATPAENKGIHGVISNVRQDGKLLVGDISIYSETMKDEINRGKKDLSMGYYCEYDLEEGDYEGQHYDAVQRNLRGNHVALVDQGRCGHSVRVYDHFALDADFKEDEHPRDEDGKFTKKGMGGAGAQKAFENSNTQLNKSFIENTKRRGQENVDFMWSKSGRDDYEDFISQKIQNLTDKQREALTIYAGHYYQDINGLLRGKSNLGGRQKEIAEQAIEGLTEAANNQFGYDQILTRGTSYQEFSNLLSEETKNKLKAGIKVNSDILKKELGDKIIVAKGFTSTSPDKEISSYFNNGAVMNIIAPAGTKGINLNSEVQSNHEVVLQRGTKFKITDVRVSNSGDLLIDAVVVVDDFKPSEFNQEDFENEIKKELEKSKENQNISVNESLQNLTNNYEETLKRYTDDQKQTLIKALVYCELYSKYMSEGDKSKISDLKNLKDIKDTFAKAYRIPQLNSITSDFSKIAQASIATTKNTNGLDFEKKLKRLQDDFRENPFSISTHIAKQKLISDVVNNNKGNYTDKWLLVKAKKDIGGLIGYALSDFDKFKGKLEKELSE